MVLFKKVNGVSVQLSAQEEADFIAASDASAAAKAAEDLASGHLNARRSKYIPQHEQLEAIYAQFQKMKDDGTVLDPVADTWVTATAAINALHAPGSGSGI